MWINLRLFLVLTTFLNLAIIFNRVSSDIPVQSKELPTISLFFLLCLFYTFLSLVWFTFVEQCKQRCHIPRPIYVFANLIKKTKDFLVVKSKKLSNSIAGKMHHVPQTSSPTKNLENLNISSKEITKLDFNENISYLNYFAFCFMVSLMFLSYLVIWLKISC